jgi:FtsZ-interacting cell division protein YlmF
MSFLRALRAYIGLGPDEEVEGRYLEELNARRRELELDEIDGQPEPQRPRRRTQLATNADNGASRRRSGAGAGPGRRGSSRSGTSQQPTRRRASNAVQAAEMLRPETIEWGHESPFEEPEGDAGSSNRSRRRTEQERVGWRGHAIDPTSTGEVDLTVASTADDGFTIDLRQPDEVPVSPFEELEAELGAAVEGSEGAGAVVRSLDVMRRKPKTVLPESFADAKEVADDFKSGVPIVLNLQSIERELARRLIDFASGVCYSLDGSMEKLASQVFLLVPADVEVSENDRRLIVERGYAR